MTSVAWSISFIGLMFYNTMYEEKLKFANTDQIGAWLAVISLFMLVISTFRELLR